MYFMILHDIWSEQVFAKVDYLWKSCLFKRLQCHELVNGLSCVEMSALPWANHSRMHKLSARFFSEIRDVPKVEMTELLGLIFLLSHGSRLKTSIESSVFRFSGIANGKQ